ncbi:hypothetical protein [Paenibacillus radicis (ex Xue et al. 2023)]|uniref:Uncharacterized protein n=1 Tax=Paenibacillus radicis (ex Xue et al. 2023) TaxID=2972489 RepID=A0ABT1YU23_9BACL|nr:hypothetical protein [Paenibacillus radicis (ex Xue et al. 2023)]MCR8636696.1 hypothetical protein [Paenibacillus radicis (ex Xue et al. 2023)]
MNKIFLVAFGFILLVNLLFDLKRLRKQHKSIKGMYITLYTLTCITFISMIIGIKIPMPTHFFIKQVSPWVFSIVHH